jgi:hypothetical protein
MKLNLLFAVLVSCGLVACDKPPPNKPPVPQMGDIKPAPGLFQDQRNALDKAKGVGAQMEEQAQRQREAAEQQEK